MPHLEFLKQSTDELLEEIWYRREKDEASLAGLLEETGQESARSELDRLAAEGLLEIRGDRLSFTDAGEARARAVVRSHRLAERLLADVLEVPQAEAEKTACLMEHILSPSVVDAVCAFLGHPPTCPHGDPIPPGACCTARKNGVQPVVIPLDEVEPGASARIVFITPGVEKRLDRLAAFGVMPGTTVELKQKRPSFVVEIEGTTLAVEREIAREIYVRRQG